MELQLETLWDLDSEGATLARELFAFDHAADARDPLHAEDEFLAAFVSFVRTQDAWLAEPWPALETARAALDLIEDLDGPWQSLPVEIWLDTLTRTLVARSAEQPRALARSFIEWLVAHGRLSLHAQRLLGRRITVWSCGVPAPQSRPLRKRCCRIGASISVGAAFETCSPLMDFQVRPASSDSIASRSEPSRAQSKSLPLSATSVG
jgi:hypothetical protein